VAAMLLRLSVTASPNVAAKEARPGTTSGPQSGDLRSKAERGREFMSGLLEAQAQRRARASGGSAFPTFNSQLRRSTSNPTSNARDEPEYTSRIGSRLGLDVVCSKFSLNLTPKSRTSSLDMHSKCSIVYGSRPGLTSMIFPVVNLSLIGIQDSIGI